MKKLLMAVALALLASKAQAGSSFLGTADQPVSNTAGSQLLVNSTNTLNTQLQTGDNTVGRVKVTDGTDVLSINADGSLSVSVAASTTVIAGSGGAPITSQTQGAGVSLNVVDTARADLDGKSLVYKSSDNMVVGGALTLTGLANQVDLQAITNDCTFNLAGGESINVAKNTAESFNFDYTATNLTVNLTAKTGAATCKVRITGAN